MTTSTVTLTYEDILSRFEVKKRSGDKCQALCPNHPDKQASLSITLADGSVLIKCHAGCNTLDVITKVNLTYRDLFLNGSRKPEAGYSYQGYEKIKYRNPDGSKKFRYRHMDANGDIRWTRGDAGHNPYRPDEVKQAIARSEIVAIPEGEKDCESLRVVGLTATTFGGASDWKDEWKAFFKNGLIVIFVDRDKAGLVHGSDKVKSLVTVCKSVKVVILPGEGIKDVTDYIMAGNGRNEINKLITAAPELAIKKNTPDKFDWHDQAVLHGDLISKRLDPLCFQVEELIIDAGTGIIAGKKKLGKSFMASQLSICKATGSRFLGKAVKQGRVVYFALEDGERRMQSRLRMQQATGPALDIIYFYKFPYLNTPEGKKQFRAMLAELRPELVIIDTLAKSLNGKPDQNAAGDMAEFGNELHDIALEFQTFILFIAHHGKREGLTRDPGFDIRGSSAIPGSTDVNIGLYRNEDKTFQLIGEGRDFGEFDFRVSLDKEVTWSWQLEGDTQDLRRKEAEDKIIEALKVLGKADAQAIAQEIDSTRQNVGQHLKRMRDYENSPIKAIVDKKKILYSLSSLSILSGSSNLSSLSDVSMQSPESDLKVKTTQGYLQPPESDESKVTNNGKVCPFCDKPTKLARQQDGDYYCKGCSNTLSESELKKRG